MAEAGVANPRLAANTASTIVGATHRQAETKLPGRQPAAGAPARCGDHATEGAGPQHGRMPEQDAEQDRESRRHSRDAAKSAGGRRRPARAPCRAGARTLVSRMPEDEAPAELRERRTPRGRVTPTAASRGCAIRSRTAPGTAIATSPTTTAPLRRSASGHCSARHLARSSRRASPIAPDAAITAAIASVKRSSRSGRSRRSRDDRAGAQSSAAASVPAPRERRQCRPRRQRWRDAAEVRRRDRRFDERCAVGRCNGERVAGSVRSPAPSNRKRSAYRAERRRHRVVARDAD